MTTRYTIIAAAISTVLASAAHAQESDLFNLGVISVGSETTQKTEAKRVDAQEMQARGDTDVGQAVSRVPGVVIREGGRRAESQASIRGFDSRQITLNIDGIPVYLPYDGNIDLSRYLASDFSRIEVQKSLGSLLQGPNNMGGSINLISRKPTKSFAGSATLGMEAGENGVFSKFGHVQVGSKLNDRFYITAGVSKKTNDDFPMSGSYSPQINQKTNNVEQPKGDRKHSANESQSVNFKVGYTPNSTDEYVVGYHQLAGQKQAAPYAGVGDGSGQTSPAYWDWPLWDKRSAYFLSHTQFNKTYLKTRVFHDKFDNGLDIFDDSGYNSMNKNGASRSRYDDQSYGGSIEVGHQLQKQLIRGTFHAKYDEHKEENWERKKIGGVNNVINEYNKTYQNQIFSFGLEDAIQITEATKLTVGYRRDQYKVTKTDDNDPSTTPSADQGADNFQIKAEHQIAGQTLFGGVSKKTRYPSIKEIYSYRMNQAIPNADLSAESALHYEVGSLGKLGKTDYQVNFFYSDISDAIESITLTSGADAGKFQNQNVGTATHYGAEFLVKIPTSQSTRLDLNYAYLKRDLADKKFKPSQSPENQGMVTMNWFASNAIDLAVDWEVKTERYTSSDGKRATDGFNLWHLRGAYEINKTFTANAVLRNAMDTDYQIYEGDPMPGRTLLLSVNAKF